MPLFSDYQIIGSHADQTLTGVLSVTVPTNANAIFIHVQGEVAFTFDGSAPDGDHGFRILENLNLPPYYVSCKAGDVFKFYPLVTGARLNYQFFKSTSGLI